MSCSISGCGILSLDVNWPFHSTQICHSRRHLMLLSYRLGWYFLWGYTFEIIITTGDALSPRSNLIRLLSRFKIVVINVASSCHVTFVWQLSKNSQVTSWSDVSQGLGLEACTCGKHDYLFYLLHSGQFTPSYPTCSVGALFLGIA